jgi:hypothetical protein
MKPDENHRLKGIQRKKSAYANMKHSACIEMTESILIMPERPRGPVKKFV